MGPNAPERGYLLTTAGRLIFNEIFPDDFPYLNYPSFDNHVSPEDVAPPGSNIPEVIAAKATVPAITSKFISKIIAECYRRYKTTATAEILDKIKSIGFSFSTQAGVTIAISDIKVPNEKAEILRNAEAEVEKIERNFRRGLVGDEDRYEQVIKIWNEAKTGSKT